MLGSKVQSLAGITSANCLTVAPLKSNRKARYFLVTECFTVKFCNGNIKFLYIILHSIGLLRLTNS
jgi:hypothetical protein